MLGEFFWVGLMHGMSQVWAMALGLIRGCLQGFGIEVIGYTARALFLGFGLFGGGGVTWVVRVVVFRIYNCLARRGVHGNLE